MAKKKYSVLTANGKDFEQMNTSLLDRIDGSETVVRLVFFGSPADNAEYITQLNLIKKGVAARFGLAQPAVSYVAQKPLVGELKMEIAALDKNSGGGEARIRYSDQNYLIVEDLTGKEMILGGILPPNLSADVLTQSNEVFGRIKALLDAEGFPINSIVRQWNYIEEITRFDGERQHYQDFNDARSHFYALTDWPAGYPAATGIGTQLGGIMVELNALIKGEGIINLPLDNSLQVAAHCYSQGVLLGAEDRVFKEKTTPKFERARVIGFPDNATVYISGTAAIRGEQSLVSDDITEQTRITMENIEFLTSLENINAKGPVVHGERRIRLLRIYIKNPEHLGPVREYMNAHYAGVVKFYLYADVCRDELLIEMEGIADIY